MHSKVSSPASIVAAIGVAAALALAAGCGSSDTTTASFNGDQNNPDESSSGGGPPAQFVTSDAAATPTAKYLGSPLCRITPTTCDPDDPYGGMACATMPSGDAGAGGPAMGCRLSSTPMSDPYCGDANPENGDGAKCTHGSECAPGFDCVVTESGGGVCRHYCCSGTCASYHSQNGGDTFCDVQKLLDGRVYAPVCMPVKTCTLFLEGTCAPDTETCGVVAEDGTTGCVATGNQGPGDSCDGQPSGPLNAEHCQAGLTCLGQPGSRKCYKLCRTKGTPSCDGTQVCMTSTIFGDPTIGICDDPQ